MPFRMQVASNPDILLVKWWGRFSSAENTKYQKKLASLSGEDWQLPRFHDAREVSMDVEIQELHAAAQKDEPQDVEAENRIKSAILVSSDLDFGMMKILAAIYNHPELDIRIFRDMDEACQWLGLPSSGDPFKVMPTR